MNDKLVTGCASEIGFCSEQTYSNMSARIATLPIRHPEILGRCVSVQEADIQEHDVCWQNCLGDIPVRRLI